MCINTMKVRRFKDMKKNVQIEHTINVFSMIHFGQKIIFSSSVVFSFFFFGGGGGRGYIQAPVTICTIGKVRPSMD